MMIVWITPRRVKNVGAQNSISIEPQEGVKRLLVIRACVIAKVNKNAYLEFSISPVDSASTLVAEQVRAVFTRTQDSKPWINHPRAHAWQLNMSVSRVGDFGRLVFRHLSGGKIEQ